MVSSLTEILWRRPAELARGEHKRVVHEAHSMDPRFVWRNGYHHRHFRDPRGTLLPIQSVVAIDAAINAVGIDEQSKALCIRWCLRNGLVKP